MKSSFATSPTLAWKLRADIFIGFAQAGIHVMYDIIATMPYFADSYLDPVYKE